MTKKDIIEMLAKYTLTKNEAKKYVDYIFETIIRTLINGEKVQIQNFGTFIPKFYKAKRMYQPKTKKYLPIEPRFKIKFVVSKKLVHLLNSKPK